MEVCALPMAFILNSQAKPYRIRLNFMSSLRLDPSLLAFTTSLEIILLSYAECTLLTDVEPRFGNSWATSKKMTR